MMEVNYLVIYQPDETQGYCIIIQALKLMDKIFEMIQNISYFVPDLLTGL
jgi:hypothetical protein